MLTWQAHAGAVTSVAFVPGGGLLSTGTDGVVKQWDAFGSPVESWKLAAAPRGEAECDLVRVLVDATGRYAAVGLRYEGVRFFDLATAKGVGEFRLAQLAELAPSPGGQTYFCGGQGVNRGGRVWEVSPPDGKVVAKTVAFGRVLGEGGGIAVAPDGKQVIAGGRRFAWPSGQVAGTATLASGRMFAVSPDGDKLFGAAGTRLMVWGLQVGAVRQRLKGHVAPITALTTTPDGRKLWTASADATVRQWDVESYRCEKCYGLQIGPLGCVAVSADGLTAAAGSAHAGHASGHIAVWDLD